MQKMINILKSNMLYIVGAIVGGVGGYLYYALVGCDNGGSCPITSSPVYSALWGAVMGALVFSLFRKTKAKDE